MILLLLLLLFCEWGNLEMVCPGGEENIGCKLFCLWEFEGIDSYMRARVGGVHITSIAFFHLAFMEIVKTVNKLILCSLMGFL